MPAGTHAENTPEPVRAAQERRLRLLLALVDAEIAGCWSADQLCRLADHLVAALWISALAEAEHAGDEVRATVLTLELRERARRRSR